jgi:hypothetical protein
MKFIQEVKRWQLLAGIITEEEINPSLDQADPNTSSEENISREEASRIIKSTKGKFFTVTFIKKDGTERIMNARLGVKAYLRGGKLPYNPDEKGLIPVYDVKEQGYRMVNINTINNLKIGNKIYNVS